MGSGKPDPQPQADGRSTPRVGTLALPAALTNHRLLVRYCPSTLPAGSRLMPQRATTGGRAPGAPACARRCRGAPPIRRGRQPARERGHQDGPCSAPSLPHGESQPMPAITPSTASARGRTVAARPSHDLAHSPLKPVREGVPSDHPDECAHRDQQDGRRCHDARVPAASGCCQRELNLGESAEGSRTKHALAALKSRARDCGTSDAWRTRTATPRRGVSTTIMFTGEAHGCSDENGDDHQEQQRRNRVKLQTGAESTQPASRGTASARWAPR